MPDINHVVLALRLGMFSVDDDSVINIIDDEDLEGVTANLSGEEFTAYNDEDLHHLALHIANESIGQIFESLLDARDQIRGALEEVETIEMFQNQEPDWEV